MFFLKRKWYKLYVNFLKLVKASDEKISLYQYFLKNGVKPNLVNPKEFMEKTLWLKLNHYTENYGIYADKFKVRTYVQNKIGKDYLNEIFGVYESASDINFDVLPNQFVLKGTHGSRYNIIC